MAPGLVPISEHNGHESHYKLTFLDMPGSGEVVRFIFSYAGVEFIDNRIAQSEMPLLKEKIPWGLVPVLEVDGEMIGLSNSIAQFLARRFGLAGRTDIEEAKVNSVGSYVTEAKEVFFSWLLEKDKERAARLKEEYFSSSVHRNLMAFERELSRNNIGGQNWFVGDTPNWCDFSVALFMRELQNRCPDVLDNYPLLRGHCEHVYQLDGIKEYLAAQAGKSTLKFYP